MTHGSTVPLTPAHRAKLRAARTRAKLTQTQLAERIGCGQVIVSNVESGAKQPSWGLLAAWCESLGLDLRLGVVKKTGT